MFVELQESRFEKLRPLFGSHKQYLPAVTVLEGNFPGIVFADDLEEPTSAVVWALGRWAYLESQSKSDELGLSLRHLIPHVIIPDSIKMGFNWFELYARNEPALIANLARWLQEYNCSSHFESVYTWDESAYRQFRSGYSVPDHVTLEKADIPILPDAISESPFVSDNFRHRTAVGFRAKVNGQAVAQCRSNGFAAGAEFMIDVETFDKNLRGKGHATAASVGLLDYCLEEGLTPLWETTEDNIASRRLAGKLGFVENESYPVFAIEF